jgi:hypothetical protein
MPSPLELENAQLRAALADEQKLVAALRDQIAATVSEWNRDREALAASEEKARGMERVLRAAKEAIDVHDRPRPPPDEFPECGIDFRVLRDHLDAALAASPAPRVGAESEEAKR